MRLHYCIFFILSAVFCLAQGRRNFDVVYDAFDSNVAKREIWDVTRLGVKASNCNSYVKFGKSKTYACVIEISESSPLFELPEWSENFEEAEISNSSLLDFLKEKIIPYFDSVDGKGENRLYLEFTGNRDEKGEEVRIIAKSNCSTCSATEFKFNNPEEYNKTYVTIISGIVVFLVDFNNKYEPSQLIKPLGKLYRPNPKYWRTPMSIHDEEGIWLLRATEKDIVLEWFVKGGGEVFREWKNN